MARYSLAREKARAVTVPRGVDAVGQLEKTVKLGRWTYARSQSWTRLRHATQMHQLQLILLLVRRESEDRRVRVEAHRGDLGRQIADSLERLAFGEDAHRIRF